MKKRLFLFFSIVVFFVLALAGCENPTDSTKPPPTDSTKPSPTDPVVQVDPVTDDFNIGNLSQTAGNVSPVTIEPKEGKSTGAITVFYNGSTDLPTEIGTYEVTFDVAAAEGFNPASGLAAGTFTISAAGQALTPAAGDFTISGIGTFTSNGSRRQVTVTPKPGKSTGAVTVKYNGNTVAPSTVGTYTVTFDVAEAEGFNPASGLSAGTLTIKAASSGGGGGGSSRGGGSTTPTVTGVTVSPSTASVEKGETRQFSAAVTGANNPGQTVTWTVTGGVSGTTINTSGLLTVAANETAASLTVKATSTVNTAISGSASVTVTSPAPTVFTITRGTGSGTLADPVLMTVTGPGTSADWNKLLGDIAYEDKYVSIDLSKCDWQGTEFSVDDPLGVGTDKIVSLILPDTVQKVSNRQIKG